VPDGLRLALTTFTVARVRGPRQLDRRTAGRAMELAPLVGLGIGLVAALVLYAARRVQHAPGPVLLGCVLAIATLALLTRGLHLDGLVDLTDGLASYKDPEGTRAVMRAPDAGPLGVAALVLVLLVQVAALEACVAEGRATASLVLAVVAGRLAVVGACAGTPAATPEGLGALVAGTVRRGVTTAWLLALGVGFGSYALVDADTFGSDGVRVVRTLAALGLAVGAARLLRLHAVRRVGGLTGDVLGALSEVATTVCLVVLTADGAFY
jgi:adenosylcobinamide-GDP ribazoletransferase